MSIGRPRILVLTPYFLPSAQGGGSVRAVHHLCQHLGNAFELVVATGDRDIDRPLDQAACDEWRAQNKLDVRYLPYGPALMGELSRLLSEPWDLIYLNSLLSPRFSALPLLLNRGRKPVLLAPRGELLAAALSRKRRQKRLYLATLHALGLLRGVHWQATSADEATQLEGLGLGPVSMAADLPAPLPSTLPPPEPLPDGPLRLIYLSRIEPQKNLAFILEALRLVKHPVRFEIYGPRTDPVYWRFCERLLGELPAHVSANYLGALVPSQVDMVLRRQELFVLPTLGENHGFAIAEALAAGCLLLISDQTPWTALHRPPFLHAIGLDRVGVHAKVIDELASLDAGQRWQLRQQAQDHGRATLDASASIARQEQLFDGLIRSKRRPDQSHDASSTAD